MKRIISLFILFLFLFAVPVNSMTFEPDSTIYMRAEPIENRQVYNNDSLIFDLPQYRIRPNFEKSLTDSILTLLAEEDWHFPFYSVMFFADADSTYATFNHQYPSFFIYHNDTVKPFGIVNCNVGGQEMNLILFEFSNPDDRRYQFRKFATKAADRVFESTGRSIKIVVNFKKAERKYTADGDLIYTVYIDQGPWIRVAIKDDTVEIQRAWLPAEAKRTRRKRNFKSDPIPLREPK